MYAVSAGHGCEWCKPVTFKVTVAGNAKVGFAKEHASFKRHRLPVVCPPKALIILDLLAATFVWPMFIVTLLPTITKAQGLIRSHHAHPPGHRNTK